MATTQAPYAWPEPPGLGALVYDTEARRVGEVRDRDRHRQKYWLRPPRGGIEWIARLAALRPADAAPADADADADADGLFPRAEPQPDADCAECRRLARQRHQARERCDLSAVTDANVLLRIHRRDQHPPTPAR